MHDWILALLVLAAPPDAAKKDFDEIADAIDEAAHESPLYATDDGVERTVAELVAIAVRESHLRPYAVGVDWAGFSYGLFQIHETNFARLGIDWKDAMTPGAAARAALVLLAESHRVCRERPLEEQLAHYASGGPTCDVPAGLAASRNRMALAGRLARARTVAHWVEHAVSVSKHLGDMGRQGLEEARPLAQSALP